MKHLLNVSALVSMFHANGMMPATFDSRIG